MTGSAYDRTGQTTDKDPIQCDDPKQPAGTVLATVSKLQINVLRSYTEVYWYSQFMQVKDECEGKDDQAGEVGDDATPFIMPNKDGIDVKGESFNAE